MAIAWLSGDHIANTFEGASVSSDALIVYAYVGYKPRRTWWIFHWEPGLLLVGEEHWPPRVSRTLCFPDRAAYVCMYVAAPVRGVLAVWVLAVALV